MAEESTNVIPIPRLNRRRGYEPTAEAIEFAIKEADRLGAPIDAVKARELLIDLYVYGFEPE